MAHDPALDDKLGPYAVTDENCKQEIEHRMGELVDLLAMFPRADIDIRSWRQLAIYLPAELFIRKD